MAGPDREPDGLLPTLWRSGAVRIFPILFLYVAALTCITPCKPSIMTDFFASRAVNGTISCDDFFANETPQACQDAHSQVMIWLSGSDFVANSVLAFFMAPVVGRWSDWYGRKPFLLLSFLCGGAQVFALLSYLTLGTSLFFMFPAQALLGAFSCISICLASVADMVPPQHRAATFGFAMASFSSGVVAGPLAGGLLSPLAAAWVGAGGVLFNVLYTIFFVKESLPAAARRQAREQMKLSSPKTSEGIFDGLRMLARSRLFVKLTVCVMLSGIVMEGMYELLGQYFQLKLQYNTADQSHMLIIAGFAGLLVNTLVLRYLLRVAGERRVMCIGMAVSCVQQLFVAFAGTKALSMAAVALGSLANISFPAISSIKSKSVPRHEQGAMQGALFGARSLGTGFGPILFATVFSLFSRTDSPFPFFPGAPFIVGSCLVFIALIVGLCIRQSEVRQSEASSALQEPLLGGAGKPQQDVESGLSESFTSAVSKLDGDAASPSPSHAEAMPEEVKAGLRKGNKEDLLRRCSAEDVNRSRFLACSSAQEGIDRSLISPRPCPEGRADRADRALHDSPDSLLAPGGPAATASQEDIPILLQRQLAYEGTADQSEQATQLGSFQWDRLEQGHCDTMSAYETASTVESTMDEFTDCLDDMHQRRSVDVRMADAATLPMAAFGAAGMETSSAVIRGLMASHDHWRQPEAPARQPR